MPIRKTPLVTDEYYHCFNRGVDKRVTFIDADDFQYFLDILFLFNQQESLGDIRAYRGREKYLSLVRGETQKLVSISSYCVNPNHFHLLLKQEIENGITDFMRKVGTGYTMYFNKKYERSGSLFQGRFKSVLIKSDPQLRLVLAYVSLNNQVHKISDKKKFRNAMKEFVDEKTKYKICDDTLLKSLYKNYKDFRQDAQKRIIDTLLYRKNLSNEKSNELLE